MSERLIHPDKFKNEDLRMFLSGLSLDHDGVVADTRSMAANVFNRIFKTSYQPHEVREWDTVKIWCKECGLTSSQAEDVNNEIWYTEKNLFSAIPLPGAKQLFETAKEFGVKIPIISSRRSEFRESTIKWYQKYFPGLVSSEQIFTCLPDIRKGIISKIYLLNFHNIKVHVDDSTEQAEKILSATSKLEVILLSNRTCLDGSSKRLLRLGTGDFTEIPDLTLLNRKLFSVN